MANECKDCKWGTPTLETRLLNEPPSLECRAHPPSLHLVPTQGGAAFAALFPKVQTNMFCGEFTSKLVASIPIRVV